MTAAAGSAAPPPEDDAAERDALAAEARALARTQRHLRRPRNVTRLLRELHTEDDLAEARTHAAEGADTSTLRKAAEWFLDNYYLIRRVARQVAQELPRGFAARLPELASGPSKGRARVYVMARSLLAKRLVELDESVLLRFVRAYQEVAPLTIAELWALPTVLRLSALRALLHAESDLGFLPEGTPDELAEIDPESGVERSVRALRLFADIDWKRFFGRTSRVESVLRSDPADVYRHMDFETCDTYRKAVEELAWVTGIAEEEVARRAVLLAREEVLDDRRGHVGYHLVDAGRAALEADLRYRPRGIRRVRRALRRRPALTLLGSVALSTAALLVPVGVYAMRSGGHLLPMALALALAAVPASVLSVTAVQWVLSRLLPPRVLPKLDFSRGVPEEARTLVVIPTLLGRPEDVEPMVRQLELHYLSNPDPALGFALLTDDVDSPTMPESGPLVAMAARGVASLNVRYGGGGAGPFHLLHRAPRSNPAEGCFLGWERKRGKLEELNRLLRGDEHTSYTHHEGSRHGLEQIRFVITLDSDTQLPIGGAARLIGLLAHPLNRAVFDDDTGRVMSGYTIAQPRIDTSPSSPRSTRFSRIFAGDVGFDIYTHAVSDVYQDLCGSGIYVGKGIYDVDGFRRSTEGRVPENALVSHDLFEGIQGRTALASDIVLFEDYPSHYAVFARRMHRWVRGDWQLLPWLLPRVPSAKGRVVNRLRLIDRWKIVDNLRRSLASPALLLLLIAGWTVLPGAPLAWTLGVLGVLLAPLLPALVRNRRRTETVGRYLLAVAFLAHEAAMVVDAVVRALVRMTITRKHLLQWVSAEQTARRFGARQSRPLLWREMLAGPLVAVAITEVVALVRPSALVVAAPLLLAWLLGPEIARWVSRAEPSRSAPLLPSDRRDLRRLARRTWLFFETFVGPSDQWLPVDNYQEEPHEQTARRTSPTNIGLMLLSTLAAHDLGYLGPGELSLRLHSSLDSIGRLVHYQGHLLNWYETKNLQPLLPQYVSTVDSGNFAGCLIALAQGCADVTRAPVGRPAAWEGLCDTLDLLDEVVVSLAAPGSGALRATLVAMRAATEQGCHRPEDGYATLRGLCDDSLAEMDRHLLALLETGAYRHEPALLHALRTWADRVHEQLQQMRREHDCLLPWLALRDEPAAAGLQPPSAPRLDEVPAACRSLRAQLEEWLRAQSEDGGPGPSAAVEESARRLREAFTAAETGAAFLCDELASVATRAEAEARGMDFRLLFDRDRNLFRIGYNVTLDRVDPHHYDLLASEARLASYLAIVGHQVPESHWVALGRPMTRVAGAPALLSWGGTMFEYLMPSLLMTSAEGTLLAQSCELAVAAQIAYGEARGAPWGISESAYARLDAQKTYQYRSFGVPGLGFKRGLEEDLVIAPYASMLALSMNPRAVVDNMAKLESMGMMGTYGFFEAVDLQPDRAPDGRPYAVVRLYMAHHQGMALVALDNYLNDGVMLSRFHGEPSVATGEVLLNERAPAVAPAEWPFADGAESRPAQENSQTPASAPSPWTPSADDRPQAFVVSNGRLSSVLTEAGGGGLSWQGLALTRYRADPTRDEDGVWIFLRDQETGRAWRATSDQGRTTYSMHEAEFHRRGEGISAHVDVTVAAADDVEVRRITLHNESGRGRRLTVTSAAEPVLQAPQEAGRHPAFSRMFIESELVSDLDALLFARRPRSPKEERAVLVHRLVHEGPSVHRVGYETDRAALYGRGQGTRTPLAPPGGKPGYDGRVGAVLDPVMSLTASVELKPGASVTLAFVTAVARSRGAVLEIARRYGSLHAARWAFLDAEQESPRRLTRARVEPYLVPMVQRLFSALLYADPTLRAPPEVIASARPCKSRLWGRGISGDDPIVFVRVHDAEAALLGETLAAQRYLRACGVRFDLVLLDEQATGYANGGSGTLQTVLATHQAGDLLNQHGGVFVLAMDQLGGDERAHLEASAHVLLDTRDGSLGARLSRPAPAPSKLPRFEPALPVDASDSAPQRPALLLDNGTGGFTEDGREYVLSVGPTSPTPAPWCNVLANPEMGCLVSESSLGSTWSLNAGENRLTPWRNDPVFDTPSEALYLRDEQTAAVWSTTPLPAGRDAETLVRHGAGYTRYTQHSHGLKQELTVFVPSGAPLKVVRLRLENTLPRPRRLTATYYAEWVLGSLPEEQRAYVAPEVDRPGACLLARCNWNAEFGDRVAFLASERELHGFTTDRTEFLGRRGDPARPEALGRWGLSGRADAGVDPCAALQVHLELAPGETVETHFVLGQAGSRAEALEVVARFRQRGTVDAAWKELGAFWDGLLGSVRVKTPDAAMDLMLNRWFLYQSLASRVFGRTAFYQSSGAFGFRDQLQDVLALLQAAPERARAHILDSAAHQFEEGDVLHWWHPPSDRGVRTRCSDDMAWLPFVTAEYVLATGDVAVLSEEAPFLSADPLTAEEHDRYAQYAPAARTSPLFEHCRRALERASTHGRHGLPLMGDGDWNDGMNRVGAKGRGESVWLGWFLSLTMNRFAAVCERAGKDDEAATWRGRAASLGQKLQDSAWDGGWYLRAFHDDGSLLGSAKSRECRIDSIAQSWAALSGVADPARARVAVKAADEKLVLEDDRLILLLRPPFDATPHDPGYIRAYPPGIRENGGQYTHAATWLGWAHVALRDGDGAEHIFRLLNPVLRTRTPEEVARYRVEPYVLAGDVYGAPPWVGRGGWTWYSGAAAWAWRLGVEGILGLRREDGALRVDPCIPRAWRGFEAWVRAGSQELHVVVENPDAVSAGVAWTTLDRVRLESGRVPIDASASGVHEVRVRLGRASPPG